KKWNPHIQLSFQNAALASHELSRECNLHLFAVTDIAKSLELMEEFVKQLKDGLRTPVQVWDSLHRKMVLVRPFPLLVLADNPMASELCSHVGSGNNAHPCRICKYGGTNAFKSSVEGLKSMFKTGEERTSGGTIENLTTLIDLAIQGNASKYSEHQSASGAKDVIVEDITDILFESRRVLSGKAPDHPRTPTHPQTKKAILNELLHEARALQSGAWHNALLQLSEHCGFSVHSQSPIECLHTLWLGPVKYLTIATVNMIDKDLLRTRLEGLDTDGLDCDNVERFGPSFSYNTERFESFNSPIREASVHSNRQAPSTDILTRLYYQELVRHVMDGGEWIEKGKVQKASSRVLAFAQSAESKVLMQKWGIQSVKKRVTPGSVTVNARAPPRAILQDEQIRAQLFEEVLQPVDDMYEEGLEISSLSQDLCKVKSHVLVEVEQGDLNVSTHYDYPQS
ncbi:hypothetical protein CF335_g8626, partial [Tilletia laevis]